jgi:serine protease AprX
VDPAGVTNGYGVPGTVDVNVRQLRTDGYTGLGDIGGHPARGFIEYAVSNRLLDARADGMFHPDAGLTRAEMADYLVSGSGVRQWLPIDNRPSFADVGTMDQAWPFVEAAAATGAPLRDLGHRHAGVMGALDGNFRPDDQVTRLSMAYSLVQSMGLQSQAQAPVEQLTVVYGNGRIAIADADAVPASLRGYVQLALDLGLVPARFVLTQGPFDLEPTITAYFDGTRHVTRAGFAAATSRSYDVYRQ